MKKHILLDIEALGLRPGSAIFELAAVEFFPETGWVGTGFEVMIEPQAPFTADLETLAWHSKKGTWPREFVEDSHSIGSALAQFEEWIRGLGEVEAFWAWGATYDFPLLAAGYDFAGFAAPWRYYETRCARTIWQTAFGDRKHAPRPHKALEDAKAAAVDLMEAMKILRGEYEAATVKTNEDGTTSFVNLPMVSLISDVILGQLVESSNTLKRQSPGMVMIGAERLRHTTDKGWTAEHDDTHDIGELREAAAAYLMLAERTGGEFGAKAYQAAARRNAIDMWPWDDSSFRPDCSQIEALTKAGAFIAAEIDRLKRLEGKGAA